MTVESPKFCTQTSIRVIGTRPQPKHYLLPNPGPGPYKTITDTLTFHTNLMPYRHEEIFTKRSCKGISTRNKKKVLIAFSEYIEISAVNDICQFRR
jgi:hypothetical protein